MRVVPASIVLACLASGATAHPLAPSLLEVRELGRGRTAVRWKVPLARVPGSAIAPVLPARCRDAGAHTSAVAGTGIQTEWTVDCGDATLIGERVGVTGLGGPVPVAVVRVELADGRVVQSVVTPGRPFVVVPPRPRARDVLASYGRLGVEHILTGPDHLLFVFGLVLLAANRRALLATVTAFTLGHSVTLSAAVLGLVRLPVAPIEVAIAASVFVLAVELARDPAAPTAIRRRPWVMAALFGLLHGLGFAAALTEAGLPQGEIPLALLAFNSGIEAGQLTFVAVVLAVRAVLAPVAARVPRWMLRTPVYAMGSLAAFWWIARTAALVRGG